MGLGRTFSARRKELGLSIEETAARAGVSRSTMFRFERDHTPQFDDHVAWFVLMCRALEMDPTTTLPNPKPPKRKGS